MLWLIGVNLSDHTRVLNGWTILSLTWNIRKEEIVLCRVIKRPDSVPALPSYCQFYQDDCQFYQGKTEEFIETTVSFVSGQVVMKTTYSRWLEQGMLPMIGLKTQALQDVGVCCIMFRVETRLLGSEDIPRTPSLTFSIVQSSPAVELSNLGVTGLVGESLGYLRSNLVRVKWLLEDLMG